MSNPFVYSFPIEPKAFSHRIQIIQSTCDCLGGSERESISIVGGPCTGKTSLLRYMASPIAAKNFPALSSSWNVYVQAGSLGTDATPAQFWATCLHDLLKQVDCQACKSQVEGAFTHAQQGKIELYELEDLFDDCAQNKTPVVLFLDEFENLLNNRNFWPPSDFFHVIRSLSLRSPRGLSFVVSTQRPILDLWNPTGNPSPFYYGLTTIIVGRMQADEVRQFVQAGLQNLSLDSSGSIVNLIIQASECHPNLVNFIASICAGMLQTDGKINMEKLYQALQDPKGPVVSMTQRILINLQSVERVWLESLNTKTTNLDSGQIKHMHLLWEYGLLPPGTKLP